MSTIVDTSSGPVEGVAYADHLRFCAIPYAAPPVGSARFRPPAAHPGWTEPLQARKYSAAAPQLEPTLELLRDPSQTDFSEDCLYLNIFTPACDDGRRPVLFWIHGGAFTHGSGANGLYRSPDLSVVGNCLLVAINYRLGPLGFLRLDEATDGACPSTGNEGLLDQIAALRWIADNAAAFGGDPDNITLFGESAGAMSVAALLAMPACKGLFRRAVIQSGSGEIAVPVDRAAAMGEQFLSALKDMGHSAADVPRLPWQALCDASARLRHPQVIDRPSAMGMPMVPVMGGADLPELPLRAVERGQTKDIDLMVGWTRDEWTLFSAFVPEQWGTDEMKMYRILEKLSGSADRARQLAAAYHQELAQRERMNHPGGILSQAMTDYAFRIPSLSLLNAQVNAGGRAIAYEFDWESPLADRILGACHALELPFLFGTLSPASIRKWAGEGEQAQALSLLMQRGWTRFAADGQPGFDRQAWPQWDPARMQLVHLAAESGLGEMYDRQSLSAWTEVAK